MNDKPTMDDAKAFDPAAHGWEIVNNTPFGDLVGPIWKRETPERCAGDLWSSQSISTAPAICTAAC